MGQWCWEHSAKGEGRITVRLAFSLTILDLTKKKVCRYYYVGGDVVEPILVKLKTSCTILSFLWAVHCLLWKIGFFPTFRNATFQQICIVVWTTGLQSRYCNVHLMGPLQNSDNFDSFPDHHVAVGVARQDLAGQGKSGAGMAQCSLLSMDD